MAEKRRYYELQDPAPELIEKFGFVDLGGGLVRFNVPESADFNLLLSAGAKEILKDQDSYRLYKYLHEDVRAIVEDFTQPPKGLNYIISVVPKMKKTAEVFDANGFLTRVVWSVYDWDKDEIIEELLKVDIEYNLASDAAINSARTVLGRTVKRQWILESGNYKTDLSDVKTTYKTYDSYLRRKRQGQIRRNNIAAMTEEAFVTLLTILVTAGDQQAAEEIGKKLLRKHQDPFSIFLEVGADLMVTAIEDETEEPFNAALNTVVPDLPPANQLYPNAVGSSIRDYIAGRYRGDLI